MADFVKMVMNLSFPTSRQDANFKAFTVVMIRVEVFQAVTPCSVVVGY